MYDVKDYEKQNKPVCIRSNAKQKQKREKSRGQDMEADGEQTFHMGIFDVGEEEPDPWGRTEGGDAVAGRMTERGLGVPE